VEMVRGVRTPHPRDYLLWGGGFILTIATTWMLGIVARRIMGEVESETRDQS
jgi:hypothetical protein